MRDIHKTKATNKDNLTQLNTLHLGYDGPVPRHLHPRTAITHDEQTEKWLRFWRGQVLQAVYALRRQRAQRYSQHSIGQLRQWRGGVIARRRTLTRALHSYRKIQQQKTGRGNRAGE